MQILLTIEFEIESAKCECPRGLEICHHIAAVLFAAHYEISRTDISCSWTPKPINLDEIKTFRDQFNFPKANRVTDRDLRMDEISEFYDKLCTLQPVGFRWILRPEPEHTLFRRSNIYLPEISTILCSREFVVAVDRTYFLKEKMKLSVSSIIKVAELTTGQTSNANWYNIRKYRLTASNFGKVISAINRNKFPPSLFTALSEQKDLSGIKAIQWGIEHEENALKVVRSIVKKEIKPTGLWLSTSGALGASPDGMIDDKIPVEAKCPFKYRNILLTEALKTEEVKSYIIYYDENCKLCLNKNHPYYHQIQGQMYLTKSEYSYLCVWTPKQAIVCKIHKDMTWDSNLNSMEEFYFERFVPYIIEKDVCL